MRSNMKVVQPIRDLDTLNRCYEIARAHDRKKQAGEVSWELILLVGFNTSLRVSDFRRFRVNDLLGKDPIMKELKAVKNNNCWVTGDSMYQRTDIVADMILDFHKALTEDDPSDLKYLQKLQ